jgi:hypothetical protein
VSADLSEQLHCNPRLGQSGNPVGILEDVEVIDFSDLSMDIASGHLQHLYKSQVGHDLDQLFNQGKRAADRYDLVRADENLWMLQRLP